MLPERNEGNRLNPDTKGSCADVTCRSPGISQLPRMTSEVSGNVRGRHRTEWKMYGAACFAPMAFAGVSIPLTYSAALIFLVAVPKIAPSESTHSI